jgi:hypothetical protein
LTRILREELSKNGEKAARDLIHVGLKQAFGDPEKGIAPDFRYWQALYDRIEGKVIERLIAEEGGSIFIGLTRNGREPDLTVSEAEE